MPRPSVAFVVPTYNEAGNIENILRNVLAVYDGHGIDGHVVVVDDGSPDGTARIVARLAEHDSRVHVLDRGRKLGLGSAYRHGFDFALTHLGVEAVGSMDADGSHQPALIPELLQNLPACGVVVASRYVGGGRWAAGLFRRIVSRGANIVARVATGVRISDMTSGYRLYNSEALQKIDLGGGESGYVFQVQVLAELSRRGCPVREIPFTFVERRAGRSKLGLMEYVVFLRWCLSYLAMRLAGKL